MADEAPARGRAHEDVGGDGDAARRAVGLVDLLDHALHRQSHGFQREHAVDAELESHVVGEELLPRAAHGVVADEPRAARVDAEDFLVVGPRRHHRLDVLRLERLVERDGNVQR
jgi:hypothetical protein